MIQVNEEYLGFRGEKSQTLAVGHAAMMMIRGGKCLPSVGDGATSAQLARETSSGGQKELDFPLFLSFNCPLGLLLSQTPVLKLRGPIVTVDCPPRGH